MRSVLESFRWDTREYTDRQVIDYTKESVVERALMSQHAPYAVVLDCVGGKDLIPYMDHLVLDDPKAPHLGHYITIVGDSRSSRRNYFRLLTRRNQPRFNGRPIHLCVSLLWR
jgi:NADPH:quinone reductase-like Zn-dependent oxidoreductase